MRVHFLSVATAFVALLFVLGTVGCKHTSGDWYKPSSYAWGTSASKDSPGTPRPLSAQGNPKPSLNDQPNINAPYGGYSDGSRATASTGASSSQSTTPWAHNQVASQTTPGHPLTGFTDAGPSAVPSHYPPEYLMGGNTYSNQQSIAAAQQQQYALQQSQYPQQHQQEMWPRQGQAPHGHSDFGSVQQTGLYQPHNPSSMYQPQPQQIPANPGGIDYYQGNQAWGGQSTYGVTQQAEPFGGAQQMGTVPSSGFGHEQMPMQTQQPGFHNGDMVLVPAGTPYQSVPYQPYQPPPASGFPTQGGLSYY